MVRRDSETVYEGIVIEGRIVNRTFYTYKNVYEGIVGSNGGKYILGNLAFIVPLL